MKAQINQFTGDGVMALFGAPVAHEDHAQRGCYAALSIQKAIEEYGKKVKNDFGAEFKMRIGLNSGLVIVGSIGNDLRMDYTAVGDTSNLAARIESMAQARHQPGIETYPQTGQELFRIRGSRQNGGERKKGAAGNISNSTRPVRWILALPPPRQKV